MGNSAPEDPGRQGSTLVTRWRLLLAATRDSRLSRTDCAVLGVILDRMGSKGIAWPGLESIAASCGTLARNVPRCMNRLVDLRYLSKEKGGGKKSNRYSLGTLKPSILKAENAVLSKRANSLLSARAPESVKSNQKTESEGKSRSAAVVKSKKRVERVELQRLTTLAISCYQKLQAQYPDLPPVISGTEGERAKNLNRCLPMIEALAEHAGLGLDDFVSRYFELCGDDEWIRGEGDYKGGCPTSFEYLTRADVVERFYLPRRAKPNDYRNRPSAAAMKKLA